MSEKKQIINIINFIRAVEPRTDVDLLKPVTEQIRLMKENNLRGTFLLQYDALLEPRFTDLMLSLDPNQFEFGVWHEIVEPETKECGIPWTGRWSWDWHTHCGFSVGYTKSQREQLCDALFEKFRSVFGYYPRVFGSWLFDTHTVRYLCDKYGLDAICNCKEQYGTDGYTLWGGYYGAAYYPSRTNVFMPAQSESEQMNVPLFRMLGSDPVYQYDIGLSLDEGAAPIQGVVTLEPVYTGRTGGGGVPAWIDWFMRENFNGDCLTFGYAQAGQENSFGWEGMCGGLSYQFPLFAKLQKEGKITVEPLGESGRRYKETYRITAPSAITAHNAYDDDEKNSVWYSTRYYRINLYADHGTFRIRDLHVFKEAYPDPYENTVCTANEANYDTLPVIDGNRHTGKGILAGTYICNADGTPIPADEMTFTDMGGGVAKVGYGNFEVTLSEDRFTVRAPKDFTLETRIGNTESDHLPTTVSLANHVKTLCYGGMSYTVTLPAGEYLDEKHITSENGIVTVLLK